MDTDTLTPSSRANIGLHGIVRQYDLEKDGFTILKGVVQKDRMPAFRDLVARIVEYGGKNLVDPFHPYYLRHRSDQGALFDLYQRHPEFRELASNPFLLEALETVLGPDILMYENTLVYKPKGKRNAVPWHQDFISRPHETRKYIAWIPVDDVRIENGAMKVIPGSHAKGFLPMYTVPGETHHDRIRPESLEISKAMFVELDAGDILIFNQLLCHSSEECHSDAPRRAFRVSYQSMKEVFVPRGSPIVMRGGSPETLSRLYPAKYAGPAKRSFWMKAAGYLGRRLIRYGNPDLALLAGGPRNPY